VLVSPATAQQFNTIRPVLIPFACWRLDDIRFEFDSSFVLPAAAEELPELKRLIDQHVVSTCFAGADLTKDGRGMSPRPSRQRPDRCAGLDMGDIMQRRLGHP